MPPVAHQSRDRRIFGNATFSALSAARQRPANAHIAHGRYLYDRNLGQRCAPQAASRAACLIWCVRSDRATRQQCRRLGLHQSALGINQSTAPLRCVRCLENWPSNPLGAGPDDPAIRPERRVIIFFGHARFGGQEAARDCRAGEGTGRPTTPT